MKKAASMLSHLFLSSLLFWGVPTVEAGELVIKEAASLNLYCHMQFAEMHADPPSRDWPALETTAGNVGDFYGPCDHDPTADNAAAAQGRVLSREMYGDGD
jgi:hypothetical protein